MNQLSTKIPLKVNKSKKNTIILIFLILNYDEFDPERTDIETDVDTLGSYIPIEDEKDNSFISGTENMNDQ